MRLSVFDKLGAAKFRLVEKFCLPGECPTGSLYERASSFGTGSRAPFRTLCTSSLQREDHVVEVLGFLALAVIAFVVVGQVSEERP